MYRLTKPFSISLRTDLLPHQREAVGKLLPIRVGALFMEEGTGRIRTALELISRRAHRLSNVVWFCPHAIEQTTRDELERHCEKICDQWHIFSIESMSSSLRTITRALDLINRGSFVILDESHYIKGPRAKRSSRLIRAAERARYRLILSGTPVTQGIQDLYNQFLFLSERILGYPSFYSFAANHLEYSNRFPQRVIRAHNTEYLAAKTAPYIFRITREACCNLPEVIHTTFHCKMSRVQRTHYEQVKRELLEEEEYSRPTIFLLFIRLQQVLSGFHISPTGERVVFRNPRLSALLGLLNSFAPEKRVVIRAKYRHDLDEIHKLLPPGQTELATTTMAPEKRRLALERFRSGRRYLLVNERFNDPGSGPVDTVIFYNNSFNYADRIRAQNIHRRAGESGRVLYIDLICEHSIDERIYRNLTAKSNLARDFYRAIERAVPSERRRWIESL